MNKGSITLLCPKHSGIFVRLESHNEKIFDDSITVLVFYQIIFCFFYLRRAWVHASGAFHIPCKPFRHQVLEQQIYFRQEPILAFSFYQCKYLVS